MIKTKKILVVCQHFWPESFRINDICDYLVEKDYQVDVLCGIPNYPKGNFYEGYSYLKKRNQIHKGVTIYRSIEIPRGKNRNINIFINYISYPFFALFHLPKLMLKKYDKIFIYQTSPVLMGLPGIILGKLKKIETTMYILDLWPENLFSVLPIQNKFWNKVITKVSTWHYKKTDKLVVLSEKMKAVVKERTHKLEQDILVMPQCCEKFYEKDIVDDELNKKYNSGFNIVFAGNISPAQSFDTILYAAKCLQDEGIKDINWIIVGDGMSRGWLEQQVENQNLDKFYFEGFKNPLDIPKYHTLADALIACLTKSELLDCTIPAKLMSYMAAGKPLLLAMDGEAQEIVNDKAQCGLACETENGKVLFENIKTIYNMKEEERKLLGQRGREYHFKHFERDLNYQRLIKFINDDTR